MELVLDLINFLVNRLLDLVKSRELLVLALGLLVVSALRDDARVILGSTAVPR